MRFMMFMIPKGYEKAAPDTMPDAKAVAEMMKYNDSLKKAGHLLMLAGLHPPSMGTRVSFSGGKSTVAQGPFPKTNETVGGYWMIEAESKEEAIEWAKRCPVKDDAVIEIRQLVEYWEFPPEVRKAMAEYSDLLPKGASEKAHSRH